MKHNCVSSPLHGLVAEGVEADVDDLEELHIHLWLLPGDRGNGVEDVLWWVQLEDSVEGGDPHLSGLGWVGEHSQEDWGDQIWVVEAGVHQGVDGEDPGHLVPGALDGVEGDGAGGAMESQLGQLGDKDITSHSQFPSPTLISMLSRFSETDKGNTRLWLVAPPIPAFTPHCFASY